MTKSTRRLWVLTGAVAILALALSAVGPVLAQGGTTGESGQTGNSVQLEDADTLGELVTRYNLDGDNLRQFFSMNTGLVVEAGQTVIFPEDVDVNLGDQGQGTTNGGAAGDAGAQATPTVADGAVVGDATPTVTGEGGDNVYVTQVGDTLGTLLTAMGFVADDDMGGATAGDAGAAEATATPATGGDAGVVEATATPAADAGMTGDDGALTDVTNEQLDAFVTLNADLEFADDTEQTVMLPAGIPQTGQAQDATATPGVDDATATPVIGDDATATPAAGVDATATPVVGDDATATPAAATQNIVEIAVADGRFTTLADALEAAGLVETLQGEGPYTVFAPTDDAFDALPDGTLDTLLMPENRDQLTEILTYHVVPGRVMAADVMQLSEATTVQGQPVTIREENGRVFINDAEVIVTDIEASNGVIHVIDSVILPPDADIAQTPAPGVDATATPVAGVDDDDQTYTVQAGDTLGEIAQQNNVTLEQLLAANPDLLTPGQTINIPAAQGVVPQTGQDTQGQTGTTGAAGQQGGLVPRCGDVPEAPTGFGFYKIQEGDSLQSISDRFGVEISRILELNPGKGFFTNQIILLPGVEAPGEWNNRNLREPCPPGVDPTSR